MCRLKDRSVLTLKKFGNDGQSAVFIGETLCCDGNHPNADSDLVAATYTNGDLLLWKVISAEECTVVALQR